MNSDPKEKRVTAPSSNEVDVRLSRKDVQRLAQLAEVDLAAIDDEQLARSGPTRDRLADQLRAALQHKPPNPVRTENDQAD